MDGFVESLRKRLSKRDHTRLGSTTKQMSCGSSIRVAAKEGDKRASVAVVLRRDRRQHGPLELLLIKRAENPRDRWSGDIALPGGRQEVGETDLDTAIRETHEEVGMALTKGGFEFLGQLDDRVASRKAGKRLIVSTFVFLSDCAGGGGSGGSSSSSVAVAAATGATTHESGPEANIVGSSKAAAAWHPLVLDVKEVAEAWWVNVGVLLDTPVTPKKVSVVQAVPFLKKRRILQVGNARCLLSQLP